MAWLSGWSKRIKLTVDNTNIDDTLSGFPVLIKISDSSGISSTDVTSIFTELGSDVNRKKIAVTTSDGITQCYVEIERFDYTNSTAWLWVKVPSVASGTITDLYLYYDNSKSDNTTYVGDTGDASAQSVWDSNFKLVMHMAQDPNGDVVDAIKDSTSNANHGTPAGSMTSADLVDGKIGKAIDFDGTDDFINCGNKTDFEPGTGAFTYEAITKTVDVTIRQAIAGKMNQGGAFNYEGWAFRISQTDNDRKLYLTLREDASHYIARRGNTLLQDATEYNTVFTYDGSESASGVLFYLDGSRETESTEQDTLAATVSAAVNMHICSGGDVANLCYGGITDEIRISNTARSAAWIKATYYSNWDGLISFGSEQFEFCVSGYVKEGTMPVTRQIYLHNRDTGTLITSTTSSGAGGYFYMQTTYSGAHYVVCLDDEAGADYNDLIYGNIYPATTSG